MKIDDNKFFIGDTPGWLEPWDYLPRQTPVQKTKRITRTIDKYNQDGKLISREVITEDEKIIELQYWTSTNYIIGDTSKIPLENSKDENSDNVKYNPKHTYSLTNGMEVSSCVANY